MMRGRGRALAGWLLPTLAALLIAGCAPAAAEREPVRYRRTGGLAGATVELTIDVDGRAVLVEDGRTTEFTVAPERLDALYAALEGLDWAALTPPPAGGPGRDLFSYEVAYGGHTATARDTQVAPDLVPVLEALNDILAARTKQA
jgi:hypothetical protein